MLVATFQLSPTVRLAGKIPDNMPRNLGSSLNNLLCRNLSLLIFCLKKKNQLLTFCVKL